MLRLLLLIAAPFVVDAAVAYALAAAPPDDRPAQGNMVFFDWDQSDLSPHARASLAEASSAASQGRLVRIILQAADGMGTGTAYGAALSRARRGHVLVELAQDGVAPDQIVRSGVGTITLRPRGMAIAAASPMPVR